jgi:hypothetical protein
MPGDGGDRWHSHSENAKIKRIKNYIFPKTMGFPFFLFCYVQCTEAKTKSFSVLIDFPNRFV